MSSVEQIFRGEVARHNLACRRGAEAVAAVREANLAGPELTCSGEKDAERLGGLLPKILGPEEISDYLLTEDLRMVPNGCLVSALTAIFGPELVPASMSEELFFGNDISSPRIDDWLGESGLVVIEPTSCVDFLMLMDDPKVVGAILAIKTPLGENHVVAILRLSELADSVGRRYLDVDTMVKGDPQGTLTTKGLVDLYTRATFGPLERVVDRRRAVVFTYDESKLWLDTTF